MIPEELKEVLRRPAEWLANPKMGARANLQYTNLQYANLWGANLSGANLQYANLQYADLRGANLWDADLQHADLQHADLRHANLQFANLRNADLRNANLRNADLRDVFLPWCVGNRREICSTQFGPYDLIWTADCLAIECQQHPLKWWKAQSSLDIEQRFGAIRGSLWETWWPLVLPIIEASGATGRIYQDEED